MAAAILPRQALPEVRTLLALDEDLCCREVRKKRIALFLRMFEKQEADVAFDAGTFVAMVERVVIRQLIEGKSIELTFELRSGQVYRIKL